MDDPALSKSIVLEFCRNVQGTFPVAVNERFIHHGREGEGIVDEVLDELIS